MEVDAGGIYATGAPEGVDDYTHIVKLARDGTSMSTLAIANMGIYAFALDANDVFWVDADWVIKKTSKVP